jgi:hypothetical protein
MLRAFLLLALLACPAAMLPAWAQNSRTMCENRANAAATSCLEASDPYRGGRQLGSGDFSHIERCMAEQERVFNACMGGRGASTTAGPPPERCAEAKRNIDWVVHEDAGARRSFDAARGSGRSRLDAVIMAQAHNPRAQRSIRECADWATPYLASIDMAAPMQATPAPPAPDTAQGPAHRPTCLQASFTDNHASVSRFFGRNDVQWQVEAHARHFCARRTVIQYTVHFSDGRTLNAEQCFGGGCNSATPYNFIVSGPRLGYRVECLRCIRGTRECVPGCG